MRIVTGALAACLLLSACSSGPPGATTATTTPTAGPTAVPADGQPAPEALRAFSCEADDDGAWSASGRIANPARSNHAYDVTVQVGPADGQTVSAKTVRVEVAPRSSTPFALEKLPTSAPDGPCHVRVLVVS